MAGCSCARAEKKVNRRDCGKRNILCKYNDNVFQTTNLNVNSDNYECVFRDNEAA